MKALYPGNTSSWASIPKAQCIEGDMCYTVSPVYLRFASMDPTDYGFCTM